MVWAAWIRLPVPGARAAPWAGMWVILGGVVAYVLVFNEAREGGAMLVGLGAISLPQESGSCPLAAGCEVYHSWPLGGRSRRQWNEEGLGPVPAAGARMMKDVRGNWWSCTWRGEIRLPPRQCRRFDPGPLGPGEATRSSRRARRHVKMPSIGCQFPSCKASTVRARVEESRWGWGPCARGMPGGSSALPSTLPEVDRFLSTRAGASAPGKVDRSRCTRRARRRRRAEAEKRKRATIQRSGCRARRAGQ